MRLPASLPRTPVLLLLVFGVLGLASTNAFADAPMPDLSGRSEAAAVRQLEALGLDVRVVTIADAAPGRVASQEPVAGTRVGDGDLATLFVGVGIDIVTRAPRVLGVREEDVVRELEAIYQIQVEYVAGGFRGAGGGVHAGARGMNGRVVGQSPEAGQALKYRGVLKIQVLRRRQQVPLVVGHPIAEARRILEEAGLDVQVVRVPVTFAARGTVVSQEPQAEAPIPPGGTVELRVSGRGAPQPGAQRVRVPELVGLDLDAAEDALISHGLLPHVHFEDRGIGRPLTVFEQEEPVGKRLAVGSHVGLTVSRPSHLGTRVRVPVLYGLSQVDAQDLLQHMGLAVQVRAQPSAFAPGTVVDQSAAPGTIVATGAPFELVVAQSPPFGWNTPRVLVPNVVGLRPAEAYAALRRIGLDVGFDLALGADRPLGRVFRQDRAAGSTVVQGTGVTLSLPLEAAVPELGGLTHHQALAALQAAGLQGVGRLHGPRIRGAISKVFRQDVAPGRLVARGSVVGFHYRLEAPAAALLRVPNVVGLSREDAATRLNATGFSAVLRAATIGAGRTQVVSQSPVAGSMRPRGHQIVASYRFVAAPVPNFVRVPRVLGKAHAVAVRELEALGFSVRSARQGPQLPIGRTEVIAQNPTGGTLRSRGSVVTLTYRYVIGGGGGAQAVQVPDVVGNNVAQAIGRLRSAGFSISVQGLGTRVQSMSPIARSFVPRGTTITLRLR